MSDWQPIETAPRDGSPLLLTDGEHLAGGCFAFRVEEDWRFKGYNEKGEIGPDFTDKVPNPDAGKRHEWWSLFGCSAFNDDVATNGSDGPIWFEPPHWMPLPEPPQAPPSGGGGRER